MSAIAMRSKRSNGYDDAFMEMCRAELTVTETMLRDGEYWVAEAGNLTGIACLAAAPIAEIQSLFVDPAAQGMGIGGLLLRHLLTRARLLGLPALELDADPNAVPFYEKHGFKIIAQVPSGSIPGRFIPRLRVALDDLESPRDL